MLSLIFPFCLSCVFSSSFHGCFVTPPSLPLHQALPYHNHSQQQGYVEVLVVGLIGTGGG